MQDKCLEYNEYYRSFKAPDLKYAPYVFCTVNNNTTGNDIEDFFARCSSIRVACIIPDIKLKKFNLDDYRRIYSIFFRFSLSFDLKIAFNLDKHIEGYIVERCYREGNDISTIALARDEYFCDRDENVSVPLKVESPCSVLAYAPDSHETTDLAPFVSNGYITWKAQYENWIVTQYYCRSFPESGCADRLSYDASMLMISEAYALFDDIFSGDPSAISALYYNDISFNAHNRANWSPRLNDMVRLKYGVDPSPFYTGFYNSTDASAKHIKALIFECRAELLRQGILRALEDFSKEKGLELKCVLTEPKLSACAFMSGDALLNNTHSPCALLDKSYLYGANSLKLAASSAYNSGQNTVNAELFRDYNKIDFDIIYRETANACARGMNSALIRLSDCGLHKDDERLSEEYNGYITRVQSVLRDGDHVCDIALLYPIYSLYAKMHLYEDSTKRFEYPDTSVDIDYMTLISSISTYAGHDLTVIHPDVLANATSVSHGRLNLNVPGTEESFSIIVLPSTEMISVTSILKLREFYDNGGKVIATGYLPHMAFEYDTDGENDRTVQQTVEYIFGHEAANKSIMKEYCYNTNDNGGEAFYLYFSRTAADGTNMTRGSTVHSAINHFNIPLDMYVPEMPRLEVAGALNNPYPEFVRLHLNVVMPGGGMFAHIHKRQNGVDVYYFSNATNRRHDHVVYLRGALDPEAWNPHNASIQSISGEFVTFRGEIYTRFRLALEPAQSIIIVSDLESANEKLKKVKEIPQITII